MKNIGKVIFHFHEEWRPPREESVALYGSTEEYTNAIIYRRMPKIMEETAIMLLMKPDYQKFDGIKKVVLPLEHKLAGQKGVVSTRFISKYETIAVYEGTIKEGASENNLHNDYSVNIPILGGELLMLDPLLGPNNLSMYINDYRDDVKNLLSPANNKEKCNCEIIIANQHVIDGNICVLVIATKDIQAGEEILTDYSYNYWNYKNERG